MTTRAKIFLAEERGVQETNWFRTYHSFNIGHYQNENKKPVDRLYLLNDETLAGKKSLHMTVAEASQILLIPVVGTIVCSTGNTTPSYIEPGSVHSIIFSAPGDFQITNPNDDGLVNFLQLWIKLPDYNTAVSGKYVFDIDAGKNQLVHINGLQPLIVIGKFEGRKKAVYSLHKQNSTIFAFIIQGAFELEEILLQTRDGLQLQGCQNLEMEALSNNAIIMLIEL